MVSVADWMRANDTDCVDVYDSELDMGRAWGLPDPESPCFDGVANGVMCAMFLMSGEAALDSYRWLAARIPGASELRSSSAPTARTGPWGASASRTCRGPCA